MSGVGIRRGGRVRTAGVLALVITSVLLMTACGGSSDDDSSGAAFGDLWPDVQQACTSPELSASLTELIAPWGSTLSFEEGTAADLRCEFRLLDSDGSAANGGVYAPPLVFAVVEEGPTAEEMSMGPLASATPCSTLDISDANGGTTCEVDGHGLDVSFTFYTKEFRDETNRLSEADMSFLLGAIVDEFVSSLGA